MQKDRHKAGIKTTNNTAQTEVKKRVRTKNGGMKRTMKKLTTRCYKLEQDLSLTRKKIEVLKQYLSLTEDNPSMLRIPGI